MLCPSVLGRIGPQEETSPGKFVGGTCNGGGIVDPSALLHDRAFPRFGVPSSVPKWRARDDSNL
jgi:hypothetical protein